MKTTSRMMLNQYVWTPLILFCMTFGGTGSLARGADLLAEHITDYSSSASVDLPGCANTTAGLFEEFGDAGGWSRTWWSNSNAWEQDWRSSHLAGGDDDDWSDAADFAYFCGHGNTGLVEFTTSIPQRILNNVETRWGNVDVEWVTFDTSNTLRDSGNNLDTWYLNAFASASFVSRMA